MSCPRQSIGRVFCLQAAGGGRIMSPMRRAGTIILWFLWLAVVAVPWSETRLPLFTNLAVAVHALLAAAWFWALATVLGWKVLGIANRQPRASRGELPTCPAPGGDASWGTYIPVVQGMMSPRQDAIRLLFAAGIGLGLLAGLRSKDADDSSIGSCPKCGDGMMRIIKMKTGNQFIGCSNYPNCVNTYSLPQAVKIAGAGGKCDLCGAPMISGFSGGRKIFEICPNPSCKQEGTASAGQTAPPRRTFPLSDR